MLHRNKSRANVEKKPEKLIKVNNVRNKDVFVLYYHQKLIYMGHYQKMEKFRKAKIKKI